MKHLIIIGILSGLISCENTASIGLSECEPVTISETLYQDTSAYYSIQSADIIDNCLAVIYSASGCSGQSWQTTMADQGHVLESYPPQKNVRMILKNEELCQAVFTDTAWYDLTPTQMEGYSTIYLNLHGYEQIPYTYGKAEKASIVGRWDLTRVDGGMLGIDEPIESGSISWLFDEKGKVSIDNQSEEHNLFASGSYAYELLAQDGLQSLVIHTINLGAIQLTDWQLIIDQRAYDGFRYTFQKKK